jgi:hypothetical protein
MPIEIKNFKGFINALILFTVTEDVIQKYIHTKAAIKLKIPNQNKRGLRCFNREK